MPWHARSCHGPLGSRGACCMDVPDEFAAGHTTSALPSAANRTEKSASGRNCQLQCTCASRHATSAGNCQCRRTCKTCGRKERGWWTRASCAAGALRDTRDGDTVPRTGNRRATCLAEADLKQIATRDKVRLARTRAKRKQQILAAVWRQVGENQLAGTILLASQNNAIKSITVTRLLA